MDFTDDVGPGSDEDVGAVLVSVEIGKGQVVLVDGGAHGAVEDEHATLQGIEEFGSHMVFYRLKGDRFLALGGLQRIVAARKGVKDARDG